MGGGIKRSQEESKVVAQGIFSAVWPGKFPRTSCFAMAGKKWRRWMLTGKNGLAWVRWGAGARRDRKTREKEGWMIEKDMFWDAWPRRQKTGSGQGCLVVIREDHGEVWSGSKGRAEHIWHKWATGRQKNKQRCKKKSKIMGSTECQVVEKNRKIQTREMSTKKGEGKQKHHETNCFTRNNKYFKSKLQKEANWEGIKAIKTRRRHREELAKSK